MVPKIAEIDAAELTLVAARVDTRKRRAVSSEHQYLSLFS